MSRSIVLLLAAMALAGCSQLPRVEVPPEGSARLSVTSLEPAPGSVVNRESVLRVRLEYTLPAGVPGDYLVSPQFTMKAAGMTTSGRTGKGSLPSLTEAQGTVEIVHPLKSVLNDEEIARPLRFWIYLNFRTSRWRSAVVTRVGPFQYYAY